MTFDKISVVGLGYIGLPTAAILASKNKQVVGLDINSETVSIINQGRIHIVEPYLDAMVKSAVSAGYLRATLTAEPADAFLIAVPTPLGSDLEPDLSYVKSASELIAPVLAAGNLIILESTCPVGTTELVSQWLAEKRPDLTFPHTHKEKSSIRLAYCPERVLPGHILKEIVQNDRIIGGMTEQCSTAAISLYETFVEGCCLTTNARTAEMCKLTENSFRDVNIAFANELSMICEAQNIDVWELISLANRHPRVNILKPGPGVGGHCIAVDPWFIVSQTPHLAKLIRSAREVNDSKPQWVTDKIKLAVADYLLSHPSKTAGDVIIGCFGLAFKADVDDLRESPAISIVQSLAGIHPGKILAVEPNISTLPTKLDAKIILSPLGEVLEKAHILVLLVDHSEFKKIKIDEFQSTVIDTRGLWSKH